MNQLIDLIMCISRDIHTINEFLRLESRRFSERMADEWMDGEQVMSFLKISKRTIQNLRDNGVLAYSRINGKFYYKASDLEKLLESNYLKRDSTNF